MSKSARDFAIDLAQFGEVSEQLALTIFHKITIDLDSAVVLGTPVDTGRARGNWFVSVGTPSSFVAYDSEDKGGELALSRLRDTVAKTPLGSIIWFSNNLPYIVPLENGHSKQAPGGMVDVNVSRFQAKYGGTVTR